MDKVKIGEEDIYLSFTQGTVLFLAEEYEMDVEETFKALQGAKKNDPATLTVFSKIFYACHVLAQEERGLEPLYSRRVLFGKLSENLLEAIEVLGKIVQRGASAVKVSQEDTAKKKNVAYRLKK